MLCYNKNASPGKPSKRKTRSWLLLMEQYGLERLCKVVSQYWSQSAEAIKEAAIADLRKHIGEHEMYDDITLVVLKQKGMKR